MGPIIVPIKKLDSSLANFFVLLVLLEMSAIYANAAGLVAEPINPFISLPRINKGRRNTKSNIIRRRTKKKYNLRRYNII